MENRSNSDGVCVSDPFPVTEPEPETPLGPGEPWAGPVGGWSSEFGGPQRTISLSKLAVTNTQKLQGNKT